MRFLEIMRPHHWIKNIFLFAGLVFGQKLTDLPAAGRAIGGFVCFCLAASAAYILNDIVDRSADSLHPEKRRRPIACGKVSVQAAMVISVVCAVPAIIGGFLLGRYFGLIVILYLSLMVLYSLAIKRAMILDCLAISVGFCLRAVAGAVVVGVFISPWLIICTFALCLFMAFSKRRSEIAQLDGIGESSRRTPAGYTPELLGHMVDVTSGLAIACFLLYGMDARTVERFGTINLVYTSPFVIYCIFRLSALMQKGRFSGPVQLILADRPFQIGLLLWALSCIAIIYGGRFGWD